MPNICVEALRIAVLHKSRTSFQCSGLHAGLACKQTSNFYGAVLSVTLSNTMQQVLTKNSIVLANAAQMCHVFDKNKEGPTKMTIM
jgi:hypothetical protein